MDVFRIIFGSSKDTLSRIASSESLSIKDYKFINFFFFFLYAEDQGTGTCVASFVFLLENCEFE